MNHFSTKDINRKVTRIAGRIKANFAVQHQLNDRNIPISLGPQQAVQRFFDALQVDV